MSDDRRKYSYWEKITAIGTLLGGAAALITALYTMNIIGHKAPEKVAVEHVQEPSPRKTEGDKNTGTVQAEEGEKDSSAKRGKLSQKDRRIGQYIDHGDGTITDTKTGLMWKRCLEGLSGVNCNEGGKVEKYTWNDAMQRFKNVAYAGYTDWRLPSLDELKTLVYCSKGKDKGDSCKDVSEMPMINQQVFPNTDSVWSGSQTFFDTAWTVHFYLGLSNAYNLRSSLHAVRLVRSGQ